MKHLLKLTVLSVLLLSLTACPKKKEDDNTTTLLLLLSMQQQQAASTEASKTAALASHPGCTKLNTASTTSQTLQSVLYQTQTTDYKANIKASLNAGQKLVITATKGTLPALGTSFGSNISVYSSDSCDTADFTNQTYSSNITLSSNSSDRTKMEIIAKVNISYTYEFSVTDVVTAGGVITYQIQ
ncbi:MAG: hypothetical protein H7A25_22895 [Leptospiraceae bacterium]|nr:hypothetical protein [Leptospiraceae bacterium]